MKLLLQILFPKKADNNIRGSRLPFYFLLLTAGLGTIRSCIHIFSPDGGAGSIAGLNLNLAGANEVVFAFGLWGFEQLVLALLQWVVVLRYRSLIPLMWGAQLLETLGREFIGRIKPVAFNHVPPGVYGDYVYIALSLAMLILALWSGARNKRME